MWQTEDESPVEEARATDPKLDAFVAKHKGTYEPFDYSKLKDHPRARVVLVGSEAKEEDWGMVEDTLGNLLWVPGKGEVVGTWTRSAVDNRIHVSLLTHISALEDRSVQVWAKYAEERLVKKAPAGTRKPRKVKTDEQELEAPQVESVETRLAFNSLRAKLKRRK